MLDRLPRTYKKLLIASLALVLLGLVTISLFAQVFLEPTLRKKIHTLIVDGSDSLYIYNLETLHANLLGGNVEIEGLDIRIDSNRYWHLFERNALPTLTMQMQLEKGSIKGIGILALLFGKKIKVEEIFSSQANIVLSRHVKESEAPKQNLPIWKSMRPALKSISIEKVKLDGVKLLYRNADTSESVKLQFDRFDADFDDIRVDSASAFDTTRIGFTKSIFLKFHDLKFRSADSSYKLKAEWITYSSETRSIEIDSFKMQPTLEKEDFYERTGLRQSLYYVEFNKIRFVNAPLERFIHHNQVEADSIIISNPDLKIYLDKSTERRFVDKSGSYPHLKLAKSPLSILVKNIMLKEASVLYTEKNSGSGLEGNVSLNKIDLHIKNITNRRSIINTNPYCLVSAKGYILGTSSIEAGFRFYLDSSNGRFDMTGDINNITAAQLNQISIPLANIELPSVNISKLNFSMRADEYTTFTNVDMRYNNLAVVLRKRDEVTGAVSNRKFLTRAVNNHMLYQSNPLDGTHRVAREVKFMRLTTQSFFGVIWKSLFGGMQQVMMRSGQLDNG